jgi:hypothetical protein
MPSDVNQPRPDFIHDLASAGDRMVLHAAHNHYVRREWSAALALFQTIHARNSRLSAEFGLPLTIGHCAIELGDDDEMPTSAGGAATGSEREAMLLNDMRTRVYELYRAGDCVRAVALLRLIAPFCPLVGGTYRDGLLDGETVDCIRVRAGGDDREPGMLAEIAVTPAAIAWMKRRAPGTRVLLVARRFHYNNAHRQCEVVDSLGRTAASLGMAVREWNSHWHPPDWSHDRYADGLMEAVNDFKPHLIWYDDLFVSGVSAASEAIADRLRLVLEHARRQFGTRVIKYFPDSWAIEDACVFDGLGSCADLIHHAHPGSLLRASPSERAATFCYPAPYRVAAPTTPAGSIPRASFVGTIYTFNFSRLVWWAEAAKRGLPVDFVAWLPGDQHNADPTRGWQYSDTDYANALQGYRMSINLTRRSNGVKILTGRSIEIPMAGGCLLEESSVDAAYFLEPGVHYLPFTTLADLGAAIGTLLTDEPRRLRMIDAAQRWVTHYYTGDYFWTGLLSRAFA